jgi:hypothetical protein
VSGSRAFTQRVNLMISRHLSPQAASARLAKFARSELQRALAGGASTEYQRFVDGLRGAKEEDVKPGGTIVYRFNLMAIAAAMALKELKKRGPQRSSRLNTKKPVPKHYYDSYFMGLNGKFIEADDFNPRTAGSLNYVVIGNVQPYSRKANVQFVGNRELNYRNDKDFFRAAAKAVQARFPNLEVKDVYSVTFTGQYQLRRRQMRTGKLSHRIKRHTGELVESPAIIIKPR